MKALRKEINKVAFNPNEPLNVLAIVMNLASGTVFNYTVAQATR